MAPVRRCRLGLLAAIGLLMPVPVAGCDSGCDTTLTATEGTAQRTGSGPVNAEIQLNVSATLTSGGRGVGGVRIAFDGIPPGGGDPVDAGGAVTDANGVARYSGPADAGLASALTPITTATTISYQAQPQVLGSNNPRTPVCNLLSARSPRANLRYRP
ncbi:hypothetical protein F0L68_35735 [Solihabitans fulvus]|uniref:Big-1 domain-containing protein n=1 Tax=Solihabitans fulvus TaxID=1892852 RepID=A0A5B2WNX9_9PSEU|nr:hypothetical protein [Solihabitans fulvus]KAA2252402.1 hypothetical protein F0L68_35735 [Solihabitans fulvus]